MSNLVRFPLPPERLRFMGESDDGLLATGVELAQLTLWYGLPVDGSILDVGCGYGRLAMGFASGTDFRGRYQGFDILRKQIAWCREEFTPVEPNYTFTHLDVRNARYNPKGKVDPTRLRFPAETASVDCVALFSVFTHFYRADIERYLTEIRRVLKPGGIAVTSWLLTDEARLPLVTDPEGVYPMIHRLDEHTVYSDKEDPLRAIAFDEAFVRSLVAAAGLEIKVLERGTWAGEEGRSFQDMVVLRRPGGPVQKLRSWAGGFKRRVRARRKARGAK